MTYSEMERAKKADHWKALNRRRRNDRFMHKLQWLVGILIGMLALVTVTAQLWMRFHRG